MSLQPISQPTTSAVLLSQQAAPTRAKASVAGTAATRRLNFEDEVARVRLNKVMASGQPLSLVNKSALASKRVQAEDVATKVLSQAPAQISTEQAVPEGDDDYSLWDLVDLINPLQHLPIVGTIYRNITGDEIKPEVQVAGSVLIGVATGSILMSAASGLASVVFKEHTGKEPLAMVAEAILGTDEENIDLKPVGEEKIRVADAYYIDLEVPPEVYTPREPHQPVQVAQAPTVHEVLAQTELVEAQTAASALLEEQARVEKMSKPSSPQFVHDFMMQALDKYQIANRQSASGLSSGQTVVQ